MLRGRFKPGVRILVLPDTRHSGTMIRVSPLDALINGGALLPDPGSVPRVMPPNVEFDTWNRNLEQYRQVARSYDAIKESVILNPLRTPVKASVLSISACQDEQQAMDGHTHGAFTGAVLEVWNNGRFSGSYEDFHRAVTAVIDDRQQVPNLDSVGMPDQGFIKQIPFTLWTNPFATVLQNTRPSTTQPGPTAPTIPASGYQPGPDPPGEPALSDSLKLEKGDERDMPPDAMLDELFAVNAGEAGARDSGAALAWPDYRDFSDYIEALGLRHFSPDELLILAL